MLCFRTVDRSTWEDVAKKVNDYCVANRHRSQNLKVHLLVAMALRNLDYPIARKLCDMLEVNMEKVPAFKDAIDRADYSGNVLGVAESIHQFVLEQCDDLEDDALTPLYDLPLDHLRELRTQCFRAENVDMLLDAISEKFRQFGTQLKS